MKSDKKRCYEVLFGIGYIEAVLMFMAIIYMKSRSK